MPVEVSVIIPVLNEEKAFGQCLDSLTRLDIPCESLEVIVVDNGSTDKSMEIARSFSKILNLTLLQKTGVHVSALRNLGASLARGEIFAFLDADCIVPTDWLTRGRAWLASKEVGVVGAHFRIPEDSGWVARAWYGTLQFEKQGDLAWVPGCNTLVSRQTFERVGGFDESIETNEDCEFCDRVKAVGLRVVGDAAIAVVHLGTPQTVAGFYRKIRWHATDGLRVFLRDLPKVSNVRPLLFAFYTLASLAGIVVGAGLAVGERRFDVLTISLIAFWAPAFLLSARLVFKRKKWSQLFPLILLHAVYGVARGSALLDFKNWTRREIRKKRILTDFQRFPKRWKTASLEEGETRTALVGATPRQMFRLIPEIRRADVILVHQDASKVFWLVLLFWIAPFLKKPIVVVDLLMRKPRTFKQKLLARVKKILLKRVDHFIHYFQDLRLYEKIYGISPSRSSYVPFKSNIFGNPRIAAIASVEKENFVFAAGWSLRDYDTFFDAVEQLGYPAAIPQPDLGKLREHGSRFTREIGNLPRNLVLLEHAGDRESWIRNLCKARVVVVPLLRDTLCSAISVYLDAMLLNKCVIISDSPGVSGILTDQAIIVPPEDSAALAQAIRNVWENSELREGIALRGQHYAAALGGEPELMNRILERTIPGSVALS